MGRNQEQSETTWTLRASSESPVDYADDGVGREVPVVRLGHGLVRVGYGIFGGLPALILATGGPGVVGAEMLSPDDRKVAPGEVAMVVTFAHPEAVAAVRTVLDEISAKMGRTVEEEVNNNG